MITFKLHINSDIFSFSFDNESKIIDLKNYIINSFYPKDGSVKYIDIEYVNDKIIRGFGKLTLEKGVISRHMDTQRLSRYNLEGKDIDIVTKIISDYTFKNSNKKSYNPNIKRSGYVPPGLRKKEKTNTYVYNEADFPPLGS